MRYFRSLASAIFTLMLAFVFVIPAAARPLFQETTVTPPQPQAGAGLYAQNCAPCHGEAGKGDGPSASGLSVPPAVLADPAVVSAKSLTELFDITKNGNMQRMMPPWKDRLSDQEIWNAVAYAWTLHTSAAQVEMGKAVFATNCATCHGSDGKGTTTGPNLTDFATTAQVSQATWAAAVANGKGTMPAFNGKLSAAEQTAALEYARSLSFGGSMFRAALAPGTGVISGTVTNGTTGQPMPDLTVELGIFDNNSLLEQRTVKTDAKGFYRFDALTTESGITFAGRVEYPTGVPISSDFVGFEGGATELNLPIAGYETTTDPSGINIAQMHFLASFESGAAQVTELLIFSQTGNRTYIGDGSGVLRFTLPQGAQSLQIEGATDTSGRFETTADGFVDKLPLPPGQSARQMIFYYLVPYTGDKLNLSFKTDYPVSKVNALLSDAGQKVTSDQLTYQGVRDTQMGTFHNLVAQDLPADSQVTIAMTNLPTGAGAAAAAGTAGGATNRVLLWVMAGIAAAAAALLIILPVVRGRTAPTEAPMATRGDLVDALARLDLAHEAGELSDAAYRDQRLHLKARLRDLVARESDTAE